MRTLNDEVIAADEDVVRLDAATVEQLKKAAAANARHRIRICAHHDTSDTLHEMVIVHMQGVYVRPHKHVGKTESMHVVEGVADVVFFDDDGAVLEVLPIGVPASGRTFFYRLASPWYHTLVVRSKFFVFHEVTNGPFHREDTVFAPWAPEEDDAADVARFQDRLASAIAGGRQAIE
jgi:cupin fold WbuC family metalloprotein